MSTYVYLPYAGPSTSKYTGSSLSCGFCTHLWKYCANSACHPCVWGSNPIDIDVPDDTWIDFYVDPSCLSVVGVQHSDIMCTADPGAPYDNAFELQLYTGTNGGGSYLGSVLYGHCDASFTGAVNTATFGSIRALTQVAYVRAGNITGCYEGSHVHMEASGASGANTNFNCNSQSWLYFF